MMMVDGMGIHAQQTVTHHTGIGISTERIIYEIYIYPTDILYNVKNTFWSLV